MQSLDKNALRQVYFDAWHKKQLNLPLTELEAMLVTIIEKHPEYHRYFSAKDLDDSPETSQAFFHMGLHVAILEQVGANHPQGIKDIYAQLCQKFPDPHQAEHQMMHVMASMLMAASREGQPPNDEVYLQNLRALLA